MEDNRNVEGGGPAEAGCRSLPSILDLEERSATGRPRVAADLPQAPSPDEPSPGRVIGYASCALSGSGAAAELRQQTEVIARECKARGLELLEVVGERSSQTGKGLDRPGLAYAFDRISSGEATGMVVVAISRITQSVGELGSIIEWMRGLNVRLIASADSLDTDTDSGRLAAGLLVDVSRWERNRISERTRHGLQAARMTGRSIGRPAVADDPDLSERIARMRAQGMTLQAIADQLNEEGVPTVRGGAKWRHSSVQAAAGYRRGQRPARSVLDSRSVATGGPSVG